MGKENSTPADEKKAGAPAGGEKEVKEFRQRDDHEDFKTLYEDSLKTIEEGQILRGTVLEITPDHVTVDVGYKSEGQIPMQEFLKRSRKVMSRSEIKSKSL